MFQLYKASQKKRKKKERIKEARNNLKIGNKVANFKLYIEERDFFASIFAKEVGFPSQHGILHHPFSRAIVAREHVLIIKKLRSRPSLNINMKMFYCKFGYL